MFVAADVFGYVAWNADDTDIGQRLDALGPQLDFISPMLYPSGFQFGIPGCANPVANPYEIVYKTLAKARERSGLPAARFRPWLQAFRDYAFDRRALGARGARSDQGGGGIRVRWLDAVESAQRLYRRWPEKRTQEALMRLFSLMLCQFAAHGL